MQTENIAYSCLTKKIINGNQSLDNSIWVASDLTEKKYSYQHFETESNRFANVLKNLGVCPHDVISIFLPRSTELISIFFAVLKNEAICSILFSTLGDEALFDRLDISHSKILITKKSLLRKVLAIQSNLIHLKYVLLIDDDNHLSENVLSLKELAAQCKPEFLFSSQVESETPAFLQFTSGSTGKPKAALHVHSAISDMVQSFNEIMPITKNEIYWCTADPAWITGLVYGLIVPFYTEIFHIQYAGSYQARNWLSILQNQKINMWYTAPTALRMLMQEDRDIFTKYDLSCLKRIYSVGEPLNPEIYNWGKDVFNNEIYDTWFQSETGSIMIANRPGLPIKPGSMGKPRSGIEVQICDNEMNPVQAGAQGHLCLRRGWNSMFRTYINKSESYKEKFNGDLYITGDLAKQDSDGYFWYVSRSDDVINTAGHLVGPFEVESALLELPEISDVAVIGVSDKLLHQKIVAFISLPPHISWSKELELKARVHVSNRISTVAIPSEFKVIDNIPKNQSGKILRRVLKAAYEGIDPGDLSTME